MPAIGPEKLRRRKRFGNSFACLGGIKFREKKRERKRRTEKGEGETTESIIKQLIFPDNTGNCHNNNIQKREYKINSF